MLIEELTRYVYLKFLIQLQAFLSFAVIFTFVGFGIALYKAPILEPVLLVGPSGLGAISLQKVDSLSVNAGPAKKVPAFKPEGFE